MNFRVEINADGADLRGVSGEISGTLAERERQLRNLFRLAEAAEDFGITLRRWADRCGLASAKEVVFIGDGAQWIWNIANRHFNDQRTTWVLDWFHLVEHLWEAARTLHPDERAEQVGLVAGWKRILRYEGGIQLWRRLQEMQVSTGQGTAGREAIESLLGCLTRISHRAYRKRPPFVR